MFARVLFLLLLALNIGVACWLYLRPGDADNALPVTDPGVGKLVLLSEMDPSATAPTAAPSAAAPAPPPASAPVTAAVSGPRQCFSIGAFLTQADMRAALKALTPAVARIQFRETRVTEARGFWVYLPAPADHDHALDLARQLANQGIRDYYVVTAGAQPNAISLGLFREQANADKRVAEVRALGFRPEMVRRSDDIPAYWVDYEQNGATPLDWRALLTRSANLQAQPIDCF